MNHKPATGEDLTLRELEVLFYVSKGLMDKEISRKLKISPRTVHYYTAVIYLKLGVRNRVEATNRYNQGIKTTHYGPMRGSP